MVVSPFGWFYFLTKEYRKKDRLETEVLNLFQVGRNPATEIWNDTECFDDSSADFQKRQISGGRQC